MVFMSFYMPHWSDLGWKKFLRKGAICNFSSLRGRIEIKPNVKGLFKLVLQFIALESLIRYICIILLAFSLPIINVRFFQHPSMPCDWSER